MEADEIEVCFMQCVTSKKQEFLFDSSWFAIPNIASHQNSTSKSSPATLGMEPRVQHHKFMKLLVWTAFLTFLLHLHLMYLSQRFVCLMICIKISWSIIPPTLPSCLFTALPSRLYSFPLSHSAVPHSWTNKAWANVSKSLGRNNGHHDVVEYIFIWSACFKRPTPFST